MANKFLQIGDIINGKEGQVTINIDGTVQTALWVKKLSARVTKTTAKKNVLGFRGTQSKDTGYEISGTLDGYYVSDVLRKAMVKYMKTGVSVLATITVTNSDPTSNAGTHRIVLKGVNFTEMDLAQVDVDSDGLEESISFTATDADFEEEFTEL